MSDNKKVILDVMKKAGKPLKAGDVAKLTDIPKEEVSKLFKEMKTEGIIHSPKVCFYAPTE
ncbi:transcriptional regulator [candidate division KSB1 bacterium]